MIINKLTVNVTGYPAEFQEISDPPEQIFHAGETLDKLLQRPRVAIVGSRRVSPYGRQVTHQLAKELAEQGIVVVSGLAAGVDSIAHRATLEAGGQTIAVLPGPLERIYPRSHVSLAARIIGQGGALISEYPEGAPTFKYHFIERNRLVAGLAQAVLVTEAAEQSGSLYTAGFARDQEKPVLAVPGNITSPGSIGTNNLLKKGAIPVTTGADVLRVLGLPWRKETTTKVRGRNAQEQKVLDLLCQGHSDGEQLLQRSALTTSEFNQVLTMLEIDGKIRPLGPDQWALI